MTERLEDLEGISLAERELIEIRAGRSVPVPLEEVMAEYGLGTAAPPPFRR